jgi:MraZ protein
MFRGTFDHAMDAKGRISLPARYRDALASAGEDTRVLIVTRSLSDTCLDVFPLKRWQEFEQKVSALPRFDPNVVKLRRLYVSAAVDCELDGQGRILIPPTLREIAKLDKQVQWAGMGDKAELWSQPLWTAREKKDLEDMSFVSAVGVMPL